MSDTSLVFNLIGKDRASRVAGAVGNAFSTMSTGIVMGGVAAGAALIKVGTDMDSAFDTIRTTTGATGPVLEKLKDDFRNALVDVPADTATVSAALADLHQRTNLTGPPLEDLTEKMVLLGQVAEEDTATIIASTTRVFGDWGIATADQSAALDMMFRASQQSGMGVDALGQQVVQFGAPLRQLGFGFEESLAMLGKFEAEGVNSELVMGSMRRALGKLARDGKEPVAAFRETVAAIKAAGSAGEANVIALEMFGAKAGPDMAAAIREGRFEIGDLAAAISGGKDTIRAAAGDTADFAERLQMLKNKGYVALEPYAMKAVDYLTQGSEALMRATEWGQRNEGTVKNLAIAMGALAGTILLVKAGMIAYTAVMMVYRAGVAVATAMQWLWNVALTANPIGLIIVGIAALVAAFIFAWTHSERFRTIVTAVFQAVKSAFLRYTLLGVIISHWRQIWAVIRPVAMWIGRHLPQIFAAVKSAFLRFALLGVVINHWSRISGFVRGAVRVFSVTIPQHLRSMASAARERITAFNDLIRSIPGRARAAVGSLNQTLVNAGRNLIQGLINGITGMIGELRARLSSVTNMIPDWKGPMSVDMRLLYPSGQAVMKGFEEGVASRIDPLRGLLSDVTATVPAAASGGLATTASRAGGPFVLEVRSGGSRLDDLLVEILARALRARGADPDLTRRLKLG